MIPNQEIWLASSIKIAVYVNHCPLSTWQVKKLELPGLLSADSVATNDSSVAMASTLSAFIRLSAQHREEIDLRNASAK